MANNNAVLILERLGLPTAGEWGLDGDIDAEDLLGRALVANVGCDDSGVVASVDGNWTDCGVRAGYFDDRMAGLVEVAEFARACGVRVVWS